MSYNVNETDEFPTTIPVPEVGDTTYPAVVEDLVTRLSKRSRHIQNSITWNFGATDAATFDSETEDLLTSLPHPGTRLGALNFWSQIAKPVVGTIKWLSERIPGMSNLPKTVFVSMSPLNEGDPGWAYAELSGGKAILAQKTVAGGETAHFDLPVPLGGYLRDVTVWAMPLTGITHSSLPANKPVVEVSHISSQVGGLAKTALGSTTDPAASTGAYDVLRGISVPLSFAMTQALGSGALLGYRIRVTGESGANSLADGFGIVAITAQFARGGG